MNKKELFFAFLSLLYFIGGLTCITLANKPIIYYIKTHGWHDFNLVVFTAGGVLLLIVVALIAIRLYFQLPSLEEILFVEYGVLFAVFVLHSHVLLTTEYVHLPQFAILTILLFSAFRRFPMLALVLSIIACIADEWAQAKLGRVLDIDDIGLNLVGLIIGLILCWCFSLVSLSPTEEEETNQFFN